MAPPIRIEIDPKNWRPALGPDVNASSWERANPRWRDWMELFVAKLENAPWRDLLDTLIDRLLHPATSSRATFTRRTRESISAAQRSSSRTAEACGSHTR